MNARPGLYERWLERKIKARALQGAGFGRAWSLRFGCVCTATLILSIYLAISLLALMLGVVYAGVFAADRDVLTVATSLAKSSLELLWYDSPLLYIYILLVLVGGAACKSSIERVKYRVLHELSRCTQCGYPMDGIQQSVCPECGTEVEGTRPSPSEAVDSVEEGHRPS